MRANTQEKRMRGDARFQSDPVSCHSIVFTHISFFSWMTRCDQHRTMRVTNDVFRRAAKENMSQPRAAMREVSGSDHNGLSECFALS